MFIKTCCYVTRNKNSSISRDDIQSILAQTHGCNETFYYYGVKLPLKTENYNVNCLRVFMGAIRNHPLFKTVITNNCFIERIILKPSKYFLRGFIKLHLTHGVMGLQNEYFAMELYFS